MVFCNVLSVIIEYKTYIALALSIFIIFTSCRFLDRNIKMPLQYYPVVFALPVAFYLINPCQISSQEQELTVLYPQVFLGTFVWVTFAYLALIIKNSIRRLSMSRSNDRKYFTRDGIFRAFHLILNIITMTIILFLVYVQIMGIFNIDKDVDRYVGDVDWALCTALVAACAALYNVQRTLKQESTKNRQEWITSVRLEAANLISNIDKIKIYDLEYKTNNYFNEDQKLQLQNSIIESCTKFRMYLNPKDMIAPLIITQLDAILNYYTMSVNMENSCDNTITYDTIESVATLNLRKSLMPWVLILLKVEWERVKAILESREIMSDMYYSKDVYLEEWRNKDFRAYGVCNKAPRQDTAAQGENNSETRVEKHYIEILFPGFCLSKETKDNILEKLENTNIVDYLHQ